MLLSACMSYSGTYRQQVAYEDGSYGNGGYDEQTDAYRQDEGYYDSDVDGYYDPSDDYYYDDGYYDGDYYGSDFHRSRFSFSFGYGSNYGYCSPFDTYCGYGGWPNYGYGYGYGWPWGYPYYGYGYGGHGWSPHDWDDDHDHHHHHHHHQPDPPGTVGTTEPGPPGRLFLNQHPRKGVYRPNAMPDPQPQVQPGNDIGDNGSAAGPDNTPPMRWRPPNNGAPRPGRYPSDSVQRGEPTLSPDRPRLHAPDAPPANRPDTNAHVNAPVDRPIRSEPRPEPPPTIERGQDNDRPARDRVRDDGGGH